MPTCRIESRGIYIHIPKTGGGWVYDQLVALGLVSETLGDHIPINRIEPPHGFRAASVRLPCAFYRSWYAYQIMRGKEAKWIQRFAKAVGSNEIDPIVEAMLKPASYQVEGFETMQCSFYSYLIQRYLFDAGLLAVDGVIVTERCTQGLIEFLGRIGIDLTDEQRTLIRNAPPVRKSPEEHQLSDATIKAINNADGWVTGLFHLDTDAAFVELR